MAKISKMLPCVLVAISTFQAMIRAQAFSRAVGTEGQSPPPPILADISTLFQSGGAYYDHQITTRLPPGFSDFPTALFSFRQGSRIFNSTKRAKTWSWRKSCAHLKAQKKCGRKTKWRRLFNCNFRGNLEPLGTQEKPENIWQMYSNLCSSNLRLWPLHCRTFSWKPTGFFYLTITCGKFTKIKQFSTYSNFFLKE